MKILNHSILIILCLLLLNCNKQEFCGNKTDQIEQSLFNTLNGGVLGNVDGVNVLELGLEFSKIGNEVNGVVIQSNHSSQDTIALNISKIPNEKLAKKISCIVFDNKIVKETNNVYVYFKWDKDSILLKN